MVMCLNNYGIFSIVWALSSIEVYEEYKDTKNNKLKRGIMGKAILFILFLLSYVLSTMKM